MNKTVVAVAALLASAIFAPAAHAADCDPDDDAAEIAECVRRAVKIPGLRQVLPPAARPSTAIKPECDADDEDDLKECLRGLKMPGAGRRVAPGGRPAAEMPVERKPPGKAEAAPAAASIAATDRPAAVKEPDATRRCQKYFPNVGKTLSVPCNE